MARYGTGHRATRSAWQPLVDAGLVTCWRCSQPIQPGQPWDLGHRDGSRRDQYAGPEHAGCNRRTRTHLAAQRFRPQPKHPGQIGDTP